MSKTLRTCLGLTLLIFVAVIACGAVWVVGTLVLGLPTVNESIGPPASGLNQIQEVGLSLYLMINQKRLDEPAGNPDMVWTIEIEPGTTAQSVIEQLSTLDLLHHPFLFRAYLRYLGFDRGIESGKYDLQGLMTIREMAVALQSAQVDSTALTIPEGWRMEQVAEKIYQINPSIQPSTFLEVATDIPDGVTVSFDLQPTGTLEGFLFPDTYSLELETTAEELITMMLLNFEQKMTPELRQGFEDQGLSLYQAVVLASIVEREAVVPDERPRIAAVFLNRLRIGMNLDADPTVQYAIAPSGEGDWWPQLSLQNLQIDSPFNTYQFPGLPPTPIASPGLDSLAAVAFPVSSSELYFRAMCDGSGRHVFAETFEDHQQNSCP